MTETENIAAVTAAKRRMYLFVCTGNSCRSPMAQALFNKKYSNDYRLAESAGLNASLSPDISEGAREALKSVGITDFFHTPQNADGGLLRKADVVVGLTRRHAAALIMAFPQYATKITSMPFDIPDPYGGDEKVYKECLDMIDKALHQMLDGVNGDENN